MVPHLFRTKSYFCGRYFYWRLESSSTLLGSDKCGMSFLKALTLSPWMSLQNPPHHGVEQNGSKSNRHYIYNLYRFTLHLWAHHGQNFFFCAKNVMAITTLVSTYLCCCIKQGRFISILQKVELLSWISKLISFCSKIATFNDDC